MKYQLIFFKLVSCAVKIYDIYTERNFYKTVVRSDWHWVTLSVGHWIKETKKNKK